MNSIAETSKIPMVGMSVVDRVVTGKEYVVKHWVTAERENKEFLKEVKKRGYGSIAVVSTTNDAMLKLRDLFLASGTSSIFLNEEFVQSDTDFRAIVSKIKNLSPDAVYLLLWAPQPGVFAKQLRQAGYDGDIFGAHNLEDPDEVESAEGALNGVWYVTGDDTAGGQFYKTYVDKFGQLPANGVINAYDIAKMMIEGSKSGDLNSYLHTVNDFEGAYGTYDATGANDFDIPATIKVITAEGFKFSKPSAD